MEVSFIVIDFFIEETGRGGKEQAPGPREESSRAQREALVPLEYIVITWHVELIIPSQVGVGVYAGI